MLAIEFETKVRDGVVKIQAEYQNQISEDVKVIILMKDASHKSCNGLSKLTSDPIKVRKIILPSREEIHER